MKKFSDAKFAVMKHPAGIVGKIQLDNGLEISIIMNEGSYGGESGLWEVGVFDGGETVDLECLSGGGVEGYLTFDKLEAKLIEIQEELKKKEQPMNFIQCGRDRFILNKTDVYFDVDLNSLKYKTRFEELDNEPIQCIISNIDELENYCFSLPINELIIVGNQAGKQLEFREEIGKIRFVNSIDEIQLPEVCSTYKMRDWK